jgi:serine/threonine protein phosphatase PrpC/CRP-like cAMP-binding protein
MRIRAQALSDVGRQRPKNEDAFLVDERLGAFMVCDGMGGHAGGEVASRTCVEVVRRTLLEGQPSLERLRQAPSSEAQSAVCTLVEQSLAAACREVFKAGQELTEQRGMGTTATLLVAAGTKAVIGHVGDSRVYLLRGGQAHQLTEDHTLIQSQIKQGILTRDEASRSPFQHVITRAIGSQESVQVDTLVVDLLPGDRFLLSSDGLHGYLKEEELPSLLGGAEASDRICQRLIDFANERGGRDNITAVVLRVGEAVQGEVGPEEVEATLDSEARLAAVRAMALFRHLTYKEQMSVLALGQTAEFEAGDEIVVQGEAGEELFVVLRGQVAVESGGVELARVPEGGHFGEMGLVDNAPRSATVRALEPTRCMVLRRTDLMALMRREPVLAVKLLWAFMQTLSDRLRATNADLSEARQELAVSGQRPFTDG